MAGSRPSKQTQSYVRRGIFPFFKLPAELRNEIYKYALKSNKTTKIRRVRDPRHKYKIVRGNEEATPGSINVNILLASRKLYNEAHSILYKYNSFNLKQDELAGFLEVIRTHNASNIESIEIMSSIYRFCTDCHCARVGLNALGQEPRLKEITIVPGEPIRHYLAKSSPELLASSFYEAAGPMLRVLGDRDGHPLAGLDLVRLKRIPSHYTRTGKTEQNYKRTFRLMMEYHLQKPVEV